MRNWKKTIKQMNRQMAKNSLEEKLFSLQNYFSEHLMQHRKYMIDMSTYKFVDICRGDSKNINDFEATQKVCRDKIKMNITKKSEASRLNINACISKVLGELRTRIMSEITLDEERKRTNPIQSSNNAATMKKQDTNSTFAKLDFPEGMTYGHRSSLRKVCSRFLRFAYLVDFLSMEALSNIYRNSITEMLTRLEELDSHGTENLSKIMVMEFDDANGGQAQRGYEPLFYINLVLNTTTVVEASDEVLVPIDDFILPPRGHSIEEDFDIFAHLETEIVEEGGGEELEDGAEPETKAPTQKYKRTMPDIHNRWTNFKPDE